MAKRDGHALNPREYRRLLELMEKMDRLNVDGVFNAPGMLSIGARRNNQRRVHVPEVFLAKITGSASVATNRWKYSWDEWERSGTGFQVRSGGRTGTTTTDYALNTVEANNDGSGVEGNSIDLDGIDFPAGFDLKAVRGNPVVWMHAHWDANGERVYTFQYENAVDGTCDA